MPEFKKKLKICEIVVNEIVKVVFISGIDAMLASNYIVVSKQDSYKLILEQYSDDSIYMIYMKENYFIHSLIMGILISLIQYGGLYILL